MKLFLPLLLSLMSQAAMAQQTSAALTALLTRYNVPGMQLIYTRLEQF